MLSQDRQNHSTLDQALKQLEWPELLAFIQELCFTVYGRQSWVDEAFLEAQEIIETRLLQVSVLNVLISRYGDPPINEPIEKDITPAISRLGKGGILTLKELIDFYSVLNYGGQYIDHFIAANEKEPHHSALESIWQEHPDASELTQYLDDMVSPHGDFKDSASEFLQQLRERRRSLKEQVQEKLQSILNNPSLRNALQEPIITEREGRFVLPVKVEFKSQIKGIIHAGSGTGATIYVEPDSVIKLNNQVQTTEADIQKEIQRLLKEISERLRDELDLLIRFITTLTLVDKLAAGARLSKKLDATIPQIISDKSGIVLKKMRHPLLELQDNHPDVVANDLILYDETKRTVVITGPNTGGKTVLLKTVGLCSLMLKAGLPIPVDSGSSLSIFNAILVDIGDQQNITQNLSTFSAHVQNLKSFIDSNDLSSSLVLIDEICAGTDPAEGAALACAVLEDLYDRGALTLVTTHLGQLKLEAHHRQGFENASVEFDTDTLAPTYKFIQGVPGTSNAITIAQKLGLNGPVIENARHHLANPQRESAELISELEAKNRKLAEELKLTESYRKTAESDYETAHHLRTELQNQKRRLIQSFKADLKSQMQPLQEQIKTLKKELRQTELHLTESHEKRLKAIDDETDQLFHESQEPLEADDPEILAEQIAIGKTIRSKRLNLSGTIVEHLDNGVVIQSGNMKVTVPVEDITLDSRLKETTKKAKKKIAPSLQKSEKAVEPEDNPGLVARELDVRGETVDDALHQVTLFLDQVMMDNVDYVGIIHGHGTNALKKAIRQYLKKADFVKRYYPAQQNYGGDGMTVVEL